MLQTLIGMYSAQISVTEHTILTEVSLRVASVPPAKYQDSTSIQNMTASFHILFYSLLFADHSTFDTIVCASNSVVK
jgi:hypothetical protein